ncbi:BRCA2 and CDKN1A-interacting protein-like [Lineus longissimus]|uniref:BRCA2 and CDKN1A-interacting protein-like n=1 Tax=Lineus longissimus TaxID=88925 RepID=UPI00315DF4B9
MSAPMKKRAVHDEMKKLEKEGDLSDSEQDIDPSSDDEKDEDSNEFEGKEIQVDFEARVAQDSDFHGIKQLLKQLLLKADIDMGELVNYVISNNNVGSVLKQVDDIPDDDDNGDDDDATIEPVFGLTSVVDLSKDSTCSKQLKSLLLERCKECNSKKLADFRAMFDSKQIGFIVNERFINLPPQVSVPLFTSLKKEIEAANKKKSKQYDLYLMIAKTYKMKEVGNNAKSKGNKNEDLTYVNQEEEFIQQEAMLTFDYCVTKEHDSAVGGSWDEDDEEMDAYRTVMVFPAERLDNIVTRLTEVFS